MRRFSPLTVLLVSALASGCATTGGLRQEPLTAGVTRTYAAPLGRVVAAARQAMIGAGITVSEVSQPSPNMWMLQGKKGTSAWSWGELVRVVVQERDGEQTTVYVITRRRMATNITAEGDWSRSIFDQIELILQSK